MKVFNKIFKFLEKFLRQFKVVATGNKGITLDVVASNTDGFTLSGWYIASQLQNIEIVDSDSAVVNCEYRTYERPDVEAVVGVKAVGFTIDCYTSSKMESCRIRALSLQGKVSTHPISKKAKGIPRIGAVCKTKNNFSIEQAYISDGLIYVSGWALDQGKLSDITLEIKNKKQSLTSKYLVRSKRLDVAEAYSIDSGIESGFIALFSSVDILKKQNIKSIAISLELYGETHRTPISNIIDISIKPTASLEWVMRSWDPTSVYHRAIALPFLTPLMNAAYPKDNVEGVLRKDFGINPVAPKATIVIPLYGRFDFMRYQLSYFSKHACLAQYEILYVVDDPSINRAALELAEVLSATFRQSFSVLSLPINVGFAAANNIGVAHASSERIILMNSDILPADSSWANKMIDSLDGDLDVGLVGARLLYEDKTIQHDGMSPMFVPEYGELFFNDHPFKGLPIDESPFKPEVVDCQLVTAACIAIKKSLYEELGGFDPAYVLGDFEDSDLCLKAIKAGKVNKICRNVSLYHLERQSQNLVGDGDWKHKVTIYNAITYNDRWAETLRTMTFSEFQLPHG